MIRHDRAPARAGGIPGYRTDTPCRADTAGPVVLALGPTTAPEVIDFALQEAEIRGVALRVVRTWDDPTVDLGRPSPEAIARWDAADERCRRDVAARLADPARSHPGVEADVLVVHESCGGLLPAFAVGAALMVVGPPTTGAHSPALAVLRSGLCPVAVVPSGGDVPACPVADIRRSRVAAP